MKSDDKPRKRSRPPLKHTSKDISKINIELDGQNDVEKVIKEALSEIYTEDTLEPKRSKVRNEYNAMISTCTEYMNSFIILGYDLQGEPTPLLFYAKTQLELDALSHYLQMYVVQSMTGGEEPNS